MPRPCGSDNSFQVIRVDKLTDDAKTFLVMICKRAEAPPCQARQRDGESRRVPQPHNEGMWTRRLRDERSAIRRPAFHQSQARIELERMTGSLIDAELSSSENLTQVELQLPAALEPKPPPGNEPCPRLARLEHAREQSARTSAGNSCVGDSAAPLTNSENC